MCGNRLRMSVVSASLALFPLTVIAAQDEGAKSTATTLDTVVVTASRTEESLREVTTNVTVITEEMIKKSSASDVSQLLRQQGFDVAGSNAGGKQLRIRGMESPQMSASDISTRVLVLLNGRRTGGPNVDFIGLANVERIEVIRGPAAVQYGPSAMGGVVNIITKRGGEKTEISAELGAGSYSLERAKLAVSGQSADGFVDFSFGGGQQYRGAYRTGNGWVWEGTRTGNQYGFNADVGINFLEGHRIGLDYNYFGIFGAECPSNTPTFANPGVPPVFGGATSHDVTNSNVALTYDGATKDKAFKWQGRVAFGRHEDVGTWGTTVMDIKNATATLGYDKGGVFALSGGADYLMYEINNISSWSPSQPEYQDVGVFLSGKLRFLDDRLIFSAGGRFDSYSIDRDTATSQDSKSQTNFSPSIGVAWLPLDWLKLRTNYSQGFKMPTPQELWGGSSYDESPDLEPEKSKTWEIGMDVNWKFINAGLTYFHSNWDNKIIAQRRPSGRWQFVNIQAATISGFELALSADLGQAFKQEYTLRPYVNLTYLPTLRNEDHSGGSNSVENLGFDTLPNTSKITMAVGMDFVEPNMDLTVNVNASYAGSKRSQDWSDPAAGPPSWQAPWPEYTPGVIVDMSIEKRIVDFENKGQLKIRAEINNIFNRYDESYITYPGPGRNFYVGLRYTY